MFDYHGLKSLAKESGCRVKDLLALSPQNDPFYAEMPNREQAARWFMDIWHGLEIQQGAHLRRIHYKMISQSPPILKVNGTPYRNTENDWQGLIVASLAARYLGLLPAGMLGDNRTPDPVINTADTERTSPDIHVYDGSGRIEDELPDELPLPWPYVTGFTAVQDYMVEVWSEKSGQNDIIAPLSRRLGFNFIPGIGEMSETATRAAIERAVNIGKPTRILYLSDFDPGGRSMPVAVARKIEYHIHSAGLEADIELHPISLLPEQCDQYSLPRTPIKDSERRKDKFEDRFGIGATEIDALEALHPGALARIITDAVTRYIDPTLDSRVYAAEAEIRRQIRAIEDEVRDQHSEEIADVSDRYEEIISGIKALEAEADELRLSMYRELRQKTPDITDMPVPAPRDPDPIRDPLYSSGRDYFSQIDHYRKWQGRGQ